jgi:hypothetical protein
MPSPYEGEGWVDNPSLGRIRGEVDKTLRGEISLYKRACRRQACFEVFEVLVLAAAFFRLLRGLGAATAASLFTAWSSFFIRRDLCRPALLGWITPFVAALSRALTALTAASLAASVSFLAISSSALVKQVLTKLRTDLLRIRSLSALFSWGNSPPCCLERIDQLSSIGAILP